MNRKGSENILVIIGVAVLAGLAGYLIANRQTPYSPAPVPSPTPDQAPAPTTPTPIPQYDVIKVSLIDAFSGQVIANADVKVQSDNGVRCVMAPCDIEGQEWTGKSDTRGVIFVPSKVINISTGIVATGYKSGRDMKNDSDKISPKDWSIELDPDEKIDNYERRLKLIDSATGKTLNNSVVWITKFQSCIPPSCTDYVFSGTTNALGNVYYPLGSIGIGDRWVSVNGHNPAKMPTGWVNYRVVFQ